MSRASKGFLLILTLFLGILLLVPVLIKPKISSILKNEINQKLNGRFEFAALHISLFKKFPKASVCIEHPGLMDASFDTIFNAKNICLHVDLKKLIFSGLTEIDFKSIEIIDPRIKLKVDSTGTLEFTKLYKKSPAVEESAKPYAFYAHLEDFKIKNGHLKYEDRFQSNHLLLENIQIETQGTLSTNQLQLACLNHIDSFSVTWNNIPWLKKIKVDWNTVLVYDLGTSQWVLKDNNIQLNELKTTLKGEIRSIPTGQYFDLLFDMANSNLKDLMSLIPGMYTADFENLKADGTCSLQGKLQGISDSIGHTPTLALTVKLDKGHVKYSQQPIAIENMHLDLSLTNLDSFGLRYKLNIPEFGALINQQPLAGNLNTTIQSSGYIQQAQGHLHSNIRLEDIDQALPLATTTMKGKFDLDLLFDFTEAQITQKKYDQIKLSGHCSLDEVEIQTEDNKPLKLKNGNIEFSPTLISTSLSDVLYGNSDCASCQIKIEHPLHLITGSKHLTNIQIKANSNTIYTNDWISPSCDTCGVPLSSFDANKADYTVQVEAIAQRILYTDFIITNTQVKGSFIRDTLTIQEFKGKTKETDFILQGKLYHPYAWSNDRSSLSGYLNLFSPTIDLNQWIDTTHTGTISDTLFESSLPDKINLSIKAKASKGSYAGYQLTNINTSITLTDRVLSIQEGTASYAGGQLSVEGQYTESSAKPEFDFKLDATKIKLDEVMKSKRLLRALIPMISFLEGTITTSSIFQGSLNQDYFPVWSAFNAQGLVELINGKTKLMEPLEELTKKIKLPFAKILNWEKSKNWFQIENGVMHVKPFEIPNKEIFIQLQGNHSIEQDVHYELILGIPKTVFDKYKINPFQNKDFGWLAADIQAKGIPLQSIDTFYFQCDITGPITHLQTQIKWIAAPGGKTYTQQLKEDIVQLAKQKTDSIKSDIQEKAEHIKDSILEELKKRVDYKKEQLDSLSTKIEDSLIRLAEDKSKKLIDSVIKKETERMLDSTIANKIDTALSQKTKAEIDKIKEKLKNWNPLKKPKTN